MVLVTAAVVLILVVVHVRVRCCGRWWEVVVVVVTAAVVIIVFMVVVMVAVIIVYRCHYRRLSLVVWRVSVCVKIGWNSPVWSGTQCKSKPGCGSLESQRMNLLKIKMAWDSPVWSGLPTHPAKCPYAIVSDADD